MTTDDGMTRANDALLEPEHQMDPDLLRLVDAMADAIGDYVSREDCYLVADELFYQIGAALRKGRSVYTPIGEMRPVGSTVLYRATAHCLPRLGRAMSEELERHAYAEAQLLVDANERDRDHFKDACAIAVLQGLITGHKDWSVPNRREAMVIRAWDIADAMAEERDSRLLGLDGK
jgi:hypothetical protein